MRNMLIIVFIAALGALVTFLLIRYPDVFRPIYIWLMGLYGLITWSLHKIWTWLNYSNERRDLAIQNRQLEQQLQQLDKELDFIRQKLEAESRRDKIWIARLKQKISYEDLPP